MDKRILVIMVVIILTSVFALKVNAQNPVNMQVAILSVNSRVEIPNAITFNKELKTIFQIKIPSIEFGHGCDSTEIVKMRNASIPISIPIVIEVSQDLKDINIYAKEIKIDFQWDGENIKEVK